MTIQFDNAQFGGNGQFINMGDPMMVRINYWFEHAQEICRNSQSCEECPLVGYQPLQTDVSVLYCENGRNKRPKGATDEQRTGSNSDTENKVGNDESSE